MRTLTLSAALAAIISLNIISSTSLLANKMGSLNIKFNKPFEAFSAPHDLKVIDIISSGNSLYILFANQVGGETPPQISKFDLMDGEFNLEWSYGVNAQSLNGGSIQIDNNDLLFLCSVNRRMEHNPLFLEIRIDINTGNLNSEQKCDTFVFNPKQLIKIPNQNITQHPATREFYDREIVPHLVGSGMLGNEGFFALIIPNNTLLMLPPYTFTKTDRALILVLATFTSMETDSFILTDLVGADEFPNFSGFREYHYAVSDGKDIRINYSIFSDQSLRQITAEVSTDSTFKKSIDFKCESPDSVFFNVKHRMVPGIYYLRLKGEYNQGTVYSNALVVSVTNRKYSDFIKNRYALYANFSLIVLSIIGWIFIYAISYFPDLQDYQFNFLSGILSHPNWGTLAEKVLWWGIFTAYLLGFFIYKLIPSTWELLKFVKK
jgi:hypothetical protein